MLEKEASIYYYVTYVDRQKHLPASPYRPDFTSVAVLKDWHPLDWAANPPQVYARHSSSIPVWWTEIPEDMALLLEEKRFVRISVKPSDEEE